MRKVSLDFLNDPKRKMMLAGLAALIILFSYYKFFFKDRFAQVKELSPQIRSLKQKVQASEREIANIPVYQKQYDELKVKIENYKKRLPYEKEIPDLLEHLSRTAKETGVKILAIEPLNPDVKAKQEAAARGGLFLDMPIKIDARSGYHQLGVFINRLENSERFIKVIDMRLDAESANPKVHEIGLVISTYMLLQELKI